MARRAAQLVPPRPERKSTWKQVQATLRAERKAWHTKLHEAASKRDWRAYRAHKQLLRTRESKHYLLNDENWQGALKTHFEGIFNKEAPDNARHIRHRRGPALAPGANWWLGSPSPWKNSRSPKRNGLAEKQQAQMA